MKTQILKIASSLAASFMIVFIVTFGFSQGATEQYNDRGDMQKAIDAAYRAPGVKECLKRYTPEGTVLDVSASVVSICFKKGNIWEVLFYRKVECNEPPCPLTPVVNICKVMVGCEYQPMDVQCLIEWDTNEGKVSTN